MVKTFNRSATSNSAMPRATTTDMYKKTTKKNIFGRTVVRKTTGSTTSNHDTQKLSGTVRKTKQVYKKNGELVKSKSRTLSPRKMAKL